MPYVDQQARDAMFDDDDDEFEDFDDVIDHLSAPNNPGAKQASKTRGGAAKGATSKAFTGTYYGTWIAGYAAQGMSGSMAVAGQTVATFSAVGGTVGAVASTAAAVSGPVGLAFAALDSVRSGVSAVKTYRHVNALERILKTHGQNAYGGTVEAILFAIKKKNKKLKRTGAGCVPVLGSMCNSVYTVGRTIKKRYRGTRGVERRAHAETLWQNCQGGDPCARAACIELLGSKIFGLIDGYTDGHLVLKKKMKSL